MNAAIATPCPPQPLRPTGFASRRTTVASADATSDIPSATLAGGGGRSGVDPSQGIGRDPQQSENDADRPAGIDDLTIFVVEDDPDVRESLEDVLNFGPNPFQSFPTAEQFLLNYLQLMEQGNEPPAGCAVLDVRMPGMSGLELQREIKRRQLPLAVVFLTGHGDIPLSVEAMRHGAIDVLEKPCDPSKLRAIVRAALHKASTMVQAREMSDMVAARETLLTARETEVYKLLLEGLETKQIGHRLGISPSTVEKHRLKVFDKMGVDTVPRLIRFVLDAAPQKNERKPAE